MLTLGDPLPSGWHEVRGESGRSALMWTLSSLRPRGRTTVLVQLGQPYDYLGVCHWCGIPPESVAVIDTPRDALSVAVELCRSGTVGQVIFEGLGFLLGSGHWTPEVEAQLGEVTEFFELDALAQEHDIALYAAGQDAGTIPGMGPRMAGKTRPMGGRLLAELSAERRLLLTRSCFLARHGQRIGEKFEVRNLLTGEVSGFRFRYIEGPERPRD